MQTTATFTRRVAKINADDHFSPPKTRQCPSPLFSSSSPSLSSPPSRCNRHNDNDIISMVMRATIRFAKTCLRTVLVVATQLNSYGATPLHVAIARGVSDDWIGRLLWAHRKAASIQDKDGSLTPLHVALRFNRTSIHTVQLLLSAFPDCITVTTKKGYLPLHVAAKYPPSSMEIICSLLSLHPRGVFVQTKRNRDTPLHLAARSDGVRSDETVLTLTDWGPSAVTFRNGIDETPFSIVCGLWDAYISSSWGKEQIRLITRKSQLTGLLKRLWNKMRFLARARYHAINKVKLSHATLVGDSLLLHASIGTSCPSTFIELVLRFFPSQIKIKDKTGRLPLAVAAETNFRNGFEGRHIIDRILGVFPEAAGIKDRNGNYPLHLAIESSKTWDLGVKQLFNAFPAAINDVHSGLPAFVLMSTRRKEKCTAQRIEDENFDGYKQIFNAQCGRIRLRTDSFDGYSHRPSFHEAFTAALHPSLQCWDSDVDSDGLDDSDDEEDEQEALYYHYPSKRPRMDGPESEIAAVNTMFHLIRSNPDAVCNVHHCFP